jgi:hypothetical protein
LRLRWSTLEQDLVEKEQQLQDALNRQQELTERVHMLKSKEMHVKEENERLLRAKVTKLLNTLMAHLQHSYSQSRTSHIFVMEEHSALISAHMMVSIVAVGL